MGKNHYSLEELKTLFDSYLNGPFHEMNEAEYGVFCSELLFLPRETVDKVLTEVYFVNLRDDIPENIVPPAYCMNLERGALKGKKGVILLTPYVIGHPKPHYRMMTGEKVKLDTLNHRTILHEIAHHVLGHNGYRNPDEKERNEIEANAQAELWVKECLDKGCCS